MTEARQSARRPWRRALRAAWACAVLAACGGKQSEGSTQNAAVAECEGMAQRLRSCGLLTEGDTGCSTPPVDEDLQELACTARCFRQASCDSLETALCGEAIPLLPSLTELERCIIDCVPVFTCHDGEEIPERWVCDGDLDCRDGEDEEGCPTFRCGSGERVPEDYRCDGWPDCDDGSDEEGCPMFACGSGELVPEPYRCDGEPDCDDASDEMDCPGRFTCDDGWSIPESYVCDGDLDCWDGEDEEGCESVTPWAELVCPD